jgi:hypothetical protein
LDLCMSTNDQYQYHVYLKYKNARTELCAAYGTLA